MRLGSRGLWLRVGVGIEILEDVVGIGLSVDGVPAVLASGCCTST